MLKWLPSKSKVEIGGEAKALLSNPLLNAAFSSLEDRLMTEWGNSKISSESDRERLYLMLQSLRSVKGELHKAVVDGEMEMRRQTQEKNVR